MENQGDTKGLVKKPDASGVRIAECKQMDLFSIFDARDRLQDDYSNTVELYDALPKYVWGAREHEDLRSATITRHCTIRGTDLVLKIKPALIERDDQTVLIYPGEREELVEDALRKLAVNGSGVYVNKKAGVSFTLYELLKELERTGHTYSLDQVKEALFVCRGAILECYSADGSSVINSSYFGLLGLTTRQEIQEDSTAKCFVQFNPLVNDSIMNLTFRQYNYRIGMDIRSALARYFYKRMTQYWIQAGDRHPYTPSLLTFMGQSPRGLSGSMREDLRAMRNALKSLEKNKVILRYEEEKVLQGKQKVIDAKYRIYPHPDFVKEVIGANQRKKLLIEQNLESD